MTNLLRDYFSEVPEESWHQFAGNRSGGWLRAEIGGGSVAA